MKFGVLHFTTLRPGDGPIRNCTRPSWAKLCVPESWVTEMTRKVSREYLTQTEEFLQWPRQNPRLLISQQPSGEFASADAPAGAAHAGIQITRSCPAISVCL
jgi:hypothetical protein